jgi:hypothetical protein
MWPWRSAKVEQALAGSAERLERTKRQQRELAPKTAELRREAHENRFEEAVLRGFRLADR